MPRFPPLFFEQVCAAALSVLELHLCHCPHCGVCASLIGHGLLYGNDPHHSHTRIVRGRRLLCSGRSGRGGCGRTCPVFETHILPRHTISSAILWQFMQLCLSHSILHAWQHTAAAFSTSCAYRIHSRILYFQDHIRSRLTQRARPPPCHSSQPRDQLIAHLAQAFPGGDPVAAFQSLFQCAFFPFPNPRS